MHLPGWEIETPEAISSYEPHLLDVIVCAKQFWSDSELTQPPFVVLPHEMLKLLHSASPQHAMPRNKMSDTQLKNYRKTARKAAEMPWRLQAPGWAMGTRHLVSESLGQFGFVF